MLAQFVSDFSRFNLAINASTDVVFVIFNQLRLLGFSKYFNLADSVSVSRDTLFSAFILLIGGSFSIFYLFVYLIKKLRYLQFV